jgi:hypothetical protein
MLQLDKDALEVLADEVDTAITVQEVMLDDIMNDNERPMEVQLEEAGGIVRRLRTLKRIERFLAEASEDGS